MAGDDDASLGALVECVLMLRCKRRAVDGDIKVCEVPHEIEDR